MFTECPLFKEGFSVGYTKRERSVLMPVKKICPCCEICSVAFILRDHGKAVYQDLNRLSDC